MSDWVLNGAGEPFEVRKYGAVMPVSRTALIDHSLVKPTPEEQAKRDASAADHERRRQAATEAWPGSVAALAAVTDPLGRAMLDLHANEGGMCNGCDMGSYAEERPGWPCSTIDKVAEVLGIPIPEDLYMAEQAWV